MRHSNNRARYLPTAGAASYPYSDFRLPLAIGSFAHPIAAISLPPPPRDKYGFMGLRVPGFGLGQSAFTYRLPAQPLLPLLSRNQSDMVSGIYDNAAPAIGIAPAPSIPNAKPWWARLLPKTAQQKG